MNLQWARKWYTSNSTLLWDKIEWFTILLYDSLSQLIGGLRNWVGVKRNANGTNKKSCSIEGSWRNFIICELHSFLFFLRTFVHIFNSWYATFAQPSHSHLSVVKCSVSVKNEQHRTTAKQHAPLTYAHILHSNNTEWMDGLHDGNSYNVVAIFELTAFPGKHKQETTKKALICA